MWSCKPPLLQQRATQQLTLKQLLVIILKCSAAASAVEGLPGFQTKTANRNAGLCVSPTLPV